MNKTLFLAPVLYLAAANVVAGTMGETPALYNNVITLSGGPS